MGARIWVQGFWGLTFTKKMKIGIFGVNDFALHLIEFKVLTGIYNFLTKKCIISALIKGFVKLQCIVHESQIWCFIF